MRSCRIAKKAFREESNWLVRSLLNAHLGGKKTVFNLVVLSRKEWKAAGLSPEKP